MNAQFWFWRSIESNPNHPEGLAAGANRSVTCVALEEGAVLVQVSRELFMRFIAAKPRTLQIYLHKVRSTALGLLL